MRKSVKECGLYQYSRHSYQRAGLVAEVERGADSSPGRPLRAPLHELVVDARLHVGPRPGATDLTHVEHDSLVSIFHGHVHCYNENSKSLEDHF